MNAGATGMTGNEYGMADRHGAGNVMDRARRAGERAGASAAVAREVRLHLHRHHASLSPFLAFALCLAAWAAAYLAEGAAPTGPRLWASAVSMLAIAYAAASHASAGREKVPGALVSALLLSTALAMGLGIAMLSRSAAPDLLALVVVGLAAIALPVVAVRPALLAGFTVLTAAPLVFVQMNQEPPNTALVAILMALLVVLLAGQAMGSKALVRAMSNDAEQRALLRRLEEANQLLSEDRVALQTESRTDPLTGVANRRYMEETLQAEWNRCRRSGAPLSCVMLDIDHFKAYNDHYGHDGGDACLRRVASVLGDSTRRAGDVVARIGGEEFVVLLPDTGSDGASTVADLLKRAVAEARLPHVTSPITQRVTVSLGVATLVPDPTRVAGELLKAADLALYEAKRSGRNRVVMADAETLDSARLAARGLIG